MDIALFKKKDENSRNYDQTLLAFTLNLCQLQKGLSGNMIFKPIFNVVIKHSNLSFSCPIKTGTYALGPLDFSRVMLPFTKVNFRATGVVKVLIGDGKKKIVIGRVKCEGEYRL